MADPEGLGRFIEGLPDGQRHKGFFWASMTAVADGLGEADQAKIERAGIEIGLSEEYVRRTFREARRKQGEQ